MRAVRTRDTAPEQALRAALDRLGVRYRSQYQTTLGTADMAFPSRRVAVFVDGAFWHGGSWRERGFGSLEEQFAGWRNGEWWLAKIRSNMARDRRQTRMLRRSGWSVLRFLDSSVQKHPDKCARRISSALRRRALSQIA